MKQAALAIRKNYFFRIFFWLLSVMFFLPGDLYPASDVKINPLDVFSIHLYVEPSAVAKADSAFARKQFKKGEKLGQFEKKFPLKTKERPVFQYVRGEVRINNGRKRKVAWRYRGLFCTHWSDSAFPHRSIKIKFSEDNEDLDFSVLNLNHFRTDPFLDDMITHEIHYLYGNITPRMRLVKFYVNDQYAGFKILVEELGDEFLARWALPIGNIYRENTYAEVGTKANAGSNYYDYWWKKASLRREKNWEDWIHFCSLLSLGRQEVSKYLLNEDYYLRWLALGVFVSISHMNQHNIYLYHNLKDQRWYQFPWDIARDFCDTSEETFLLAPNKIYAAVLMDPYNYHKRNQLAWGFLNNDSFFSEMIKIVDKVYEDYLREIEYCQEHLAEYEQSPFVSLNLDEIKAKKQQVPFLIGEKRDKLRNDFVSLPTFESIVAGEKIIVKGNSRLGFKMKTNAWVLEKYENLKMTAADRGVCQFLITFDHLDTLNNNKVQLEPKDFYLELVNALGSKHQPQVASLFCDKYEDLITNKERIEPVEDNFKEDKTDFVHDRRMNKFLQSLIRCSAKFWARIKGVKIWDKFNDKKYLKVCIEHAILSLDHLKKRDYLTTGEVIRWSQERTLRRTTVVPFNTTLILEPGMILRLARGVSLVVEGSLIVRGTEDNKVLITAAADKPRSLDYWGSICFIHSLSQNSSMSHAIVEYGSEDHIKGVHSTGALSAYHVPFNISNCEFRYNQGDDAVNFRYSIATVENSKFHHNRADAIDSDFSNVKIQGTDFYKNGNDGVDCGTSLVEIEENVFFRHEDKAISVGEESDVNIHHNILQENNMAIAVKDSSTALIRDNVFADNKYAIKAYIKKIKYEKPKYTLAQNYIFNNEHDFDDTCSIKGYDLAAGSFLKLDSFNQVRGQLQDSFSPDAFCRWEEYARSRD